MACPLCEDILIKVHKPRKDLDAKDVFNVGVNYSNELKAILVNSMYAARIPHADSLALLNKTLPDAAAHLYRNDPEFHGLVDHTLEQIIAVLAIRRMTE